MTVPVRWWSEPVAATGSAKSDGIRKQLGTPRMDPLTVLVRESAQNSWDARDETGTGVHYAIDLRRLDQVETDEWASLLGRGPDGAQIGIDELLGAGDPVLVTVSDRGTVGLGGPLRADEVGPGEKGADFVNLLRNIGEPRDRDYGGGTYGFGKGVLYTSSSIGTIVVRTRCRWRGALQTRLIGAALGFGFHKGGRAYTGRHWWGDIVDGIPDPLLDDDADDVAAALNLPPMYPDETGTDIVIVGVRLGSMPGGEDDVERPRSLRDASEYLASAMMWNLWPLLLPNDHGVVQMSCHVTAQGEPIQVPDPTKELCILPFVEAYSALRDDSIVIRRKKPLTDIGRFVARRHIAPLRRNAATLAAPFSGNAHHCARMREPRLIVDYLAGPPLVDETSHYGAVFVADREHDRIFAEAEPPTHDTWVWENLSDKYERGIVRRARDEVKAALEVFANSDGAGVSGIADQPPLGALAGRLASLLPTAHGPGAAERAGGGGGYEGGGMGRVVAQIIDPPRMVRLDEGPRLVVGFRVSPTASPVTVKVLPNVALDIGSETEPPAGAAVPFVLEIRSTEGQVRTGDSVTLAPDDPREWTAIIMPASGAAAKVKLVVAEGEPS